ncbi:MAG: hypothetical protein H7X80_05695, partial [bacterium]|nr:hypothetical protein [Candidatus Kapabacteria bacterium]
MKFVSLILFLIASCCSAQSLNWTKFFSAGFYDNAADAIGTSDGGVIVVGTTRLLQGLDTNTVALAFKLDARGDVIWQKALGPHHSSAYAVFAMSDATYTIIGVRRVGTPLNDIFVMSIDADGSLLRDTLLVTDGVNEVIGDVTR